MSGAVLAAAGLSKAFGGVHAVEAVSFAAAPGAVTALIGPNGAGKTTLFNLITGLYAPSAGTVTLDGADVTGLAPHQLARRGVARTFQNLQIFERMTAVENVMVGRHLHVRKDLLGSLLRLPGLRRSEEACRARSLELLDYVGLADCAEAEAGGLPYGALKRLEIARALAARPKLLLLDEPAAGCNPTETAELDALIKRIVAQGITVVLVEHDMKMVMGISDHVVVLESGRKLAEGTVAEIRSNPDVIRAYLGGHGGEARVGDAAAG